MSERLTLQDLIDLLSDKQNITKKDAETFLRELITLTSETIEGKDFVRIKDFGTFKLTKVNSRRSVDVNTGDPIEIPAHYKLSFAPDKVLREGVNRPFSHFESIVLEDEAVFEDKVKADKKATPKKVESKAKPKTEDAKQAVEAKPIPKKEEVKAVIAEKDEEVENKVDEVLEKTPNSKTLKKEVITSKDLEKEGELSDINTFLTKGIEEKKEVEPLVTSSDSSVLVEDEPEKSASRISREYEEDDFIDYDYLARQKRKRNTWIGVGALVFLIAVGAFWKYNDYMSAPKPIPYAQDNSTLIVSDEDDTVVGDGTTTLETELLEVDQVNEANQEPTLVEEPVKTVTPAQAGKEVEVKAGQTMRVLGLEYFGHGSFWVYIFEENRDKIDRPDAVYAGMKLVIPPASKYDIDPDDKASVRKAQRQEMKLFGEFSDK